MTHLAALVLVWMVHLQNPNLLTPEWAASYIETAQEIANASEVRPLSVGPTMTAAILTITAFRESHFNPNPCTEKWDCDHGASLGRWQTWHKWGPPTAETALWVMEKSFEICRHHPLDERLSWYAAGNSGCERRNELSRARMRAAKELVESVKEPM